MDAAPPSSTPLLPRLFISAVSGEFKTVRQQVAAVVRQLGYQAVSMDDWPAGHGELRAWLREQIDSCDGLIHLPGLAYGAEPEVHDPAAHGLPADTPRYSYTQYEFLHAQAQGKKTWVIQPGPGCTRDNAPEKLDLPTDPAVADPGAYQSQRRDLQAAWLQKLKKDNHLRHQPKDDKDLQLILHTLRDHAQDMRQRFGDWQDFVANHMRRTENRQRRMLAIAVSTFVLLLVVSLVVALVKRDSGHTVSKVNTVLKQQDETATKLDRVMEAMGQLAMQNGSKQDPISQWPQGRLETELARQTDMTVEALRALLIVGKTSLDALRQGQALLASGKPTEADQKFVQVLDQEKDSAKRMRQALDGRAQIAYDKVQYEKALEFRQRAAALVDKEAEPLEWAEEQYWVAYVLDDLARPKEAETLLREVIRIREEKLGANDPKVAAAINDLAQVLQATNRLAEAEPLMRRALEIGETSYGPDHPKVAIRLNNLAQLLQDTNRLTEAEPLMQRALKIDETSYGSDHPKVAIRLNNLAQLLQDTNRVSEAEPLMRRVVTIFEQAYSPDHPKVAAALNNLAQLLKATNRLTEAEPLMQRALKIDETSYGPDHPNVATALNNRAQLLQATNRLTEAEPLMRRALKIDENSFGPDHPNVARDLNNLAQLLKATNRLKEAEPLERRMVQIFLRFHKSTGHEHPNAQAGIANYMSILFAQKLDAAAIRSRLDTLADEVPMDRAEFAKLWQSVLDAASKPASTGPFEVTVTEVIATGQGPGLGIKEGDVIRRYHGEEITSGEQLNKIRDATQDASIPLEIQRGDQTLKLTARPGKLGLMLENKPRAVAKGS